MWLAATRRACPWLLLVLAAPPSFAFPGSARWGYANCATCHFNVSGGGVLTSYGRQLSRELLSTKGGEAEPEFAYGGWKTPAWLALGGDFSAQVESRSSPGSSSGFDLMQADVEGAATRGRFLALATLGLEPDEDGPGAQGVISRRHYLQYNFTPALSLRAGRFLPNYGVWNGDLDVATRTGLGWRENDTSYNFELNLVEQRFNFAGTAIVTQTDRPAAERESGASFSTSMFFANKVRVGLSALSLSSDQLTRRAGGVYGVIGVGSHAYLLTETDFQRLRDGPLPARWDVFSNWCFARETFKGLYVLLVNEWSRTNLGDPGRLAFSYGVSLRWFARPHWELQARWRHQDRDAVSPGNLDGLSAFLHFYP